MRRGYCKNGTLDLRRMPHIIQRPLGRSQAYGFAAQQLHGDAGGEAPTPEWQGEPTIWLDPTYDGTRRGLETAVHEALHLACPWMFEQVVTQTARYLAMVLWRLGYRKVDHDS